MNKNQKQLQHYGVLGMRWGHRKGLGRVSVQPGVRGAVKEVKGLVKDAVADDITKARTLASKITGSKAFKATVYNKDRGGLLRKDILESDLAKGKSAISKLVQSKAFKTFIFDKEKFQSSVAAARSGAKTVLTKIADRSNRKAIAAQDRDIKLFDDIIAGYDKVGKVRPLTIGERKDRASFEQASKKLKDELNYLFTPEELKKYRS